MNPMRRIRLWWLVRVRGLTREAALDLMDGEDLGVPASIASARAAPPEQYRFRCLTCGLEDASAFVLAGHLRFCRRPVIVRLKTARELDGLDRRLLAGHGPEIEAILAGAWRDLPGSDHVH